MTPEQWQAVTEAFDRAMRLPPASRDAFVREVLTRDPVVGQRLQAMLAPHDEGATLHMDYPTPPRPPGALPDGELVADRYQIGEVIGEGGFGKVYLAQDRRLDNRKVVVKTLAAAHEGWHEKRFQEEVRALARMDHPGIVGVIDSGRLPDGAGFLVMQYVPGESLHNLICKGPMVAGRAVKLLGQMAEALAVAHDAGILHRDLKPANVIVRDAGKPEERAVLIDFGIARTDAGDLGAKTSLVSGTPRYMAPEQSMGHTNASSDLFSLGLIAVEMFTGKHVERLTAVEDLTQRVRRELAVVTPPVPAPAMDAVASSVALMGSDRPASAQAFARAMLPPPAALPVSRSRAPWIAAAVAALITIGGLIYYFLPRGVDVSAALSVRAGGGSRAISPTDPLHAGDGVQVVVDASEPGFLYLFDETPGVAQFAVLYPGSGAASAIPAKRSLRIPAAADAWLVLDGSSPEEHFWIVWSRQPVPELEDLQKYAKPPRYGLVPEERASRLRTFLTSAETAAKGSVWHTGSDHMAARLRLAVR